MEYRVVEARSAADLERQIQDLLREGWQPQGGIAVGTYGAGTWWYYQAVVRP